MVLSKEVRKALKFTCSRKPSPDPALTTKSTLTSVREPGVREGGGVVRVGAGGKAAGPRSLFCVLFTLLSLHPYVLSWKEGGVVKWDVRPGKKGTCGGGGEEDFDLRWV